MNIWGWIKALFQSDEFKALLKKIIDILLNTVKKVGKENLDKIIAKIKECAAHPTMSNQDKMITVIAYAQSLIPGMTESALRFLIEGLIQDLKSNGSIE